MCGIEKFAVYIFKPRECVYEFTEENFIDTTTIKERTKSKKYAYTVIKKVVDKNGLILIYNSSFTAFVLDKNGFEEGDSDALKEFLKSKIPFLKIV